jgi:hypothetical protein
MISTVYSPRLRRQNGAQIQPQTLEEASCGFRVGPDGKPELRFRPRPPVVSSSS